MAGAVGTASGGSVWNLTATEMKNRIIILIRRLMQSEPTYDEVQVIKDSINEALQRLCMSRKIGRWRFLNTDYSVTLTAGQKYIDLTNEIMNIIAGTVRIESEDVMLQPATLEAIKMDDPDQSGTGTPLLYAFDSAAAGPDVARLWFDVKPTSAFTLDFTGTRIVDEDETDGFPSWLAGPILDLASSIALRRLGIPGAEYYYSAYQDSITDAKMAQGHDGPRHIQRTTDRVVYQGLESRTP